MSTQSLPVDSVFHQGPSWAVGAGSLPSLLKDSSDATYLVDSVVASNHALTLNPYATPFWGPNAQVVGIAPFVRCSAASGTQRIQVRVASRQPGVAPYESPWTTIQPTPTIQTFLGAAGPGVPKQPRMPDVLTNNYVTRMFKGLLLEVRDVPGDDGSSWVGNLRLYDAGMSVEAITAPTNPDNTPSIVAGGPKGLQTVTLGWNGWSSGADSVIAATIAFYKYSDVATDKNFAYYVNNLEDGQIPGAFINDAGVLVEPATGTGSCDWGGYEDLADYTQYDWRFINYDIDESRLTPGVQYAWTQQGGVLANGDMRWGVADIGNSAGFEVYNHSATPSLTAAVLAGDLTATWDAATQRAVLTLKAHVNEIYDYAANNDQAGSNGWNNSVNATSITSGVAVTVGSGTAVRFQSSASGNMAIIGVGSGFGTLITNASNPAALPRVQVGTVYTAQIKTRAATVARSVRLDIQWRSATDAILSTTTGSAVANTTSGGTTISTQGTAPANAVYATLLVTVLATAAAAEQHYIDDVVFAPGTSAQVVFSRGMHRYRVVGFDLPEFLIDRSLDSGLTWRRIAEVPFTFESGQQATYYDAALGHGQSAIYRMRVRDYEAVGQFVQINSYVTAFTSNTGAVVASRSDWSLTDPDATAGRVPVQVMGDLPSNYASKSEPHALLGSDRYSVVSDSAAGAQAFRVRAVFKSETAWQAWEVLRKSRKTLLFTGDVAAAGWWVQIADDVTTTLLYSTARKTAGTRARTVEFTLYEVEPPSPGLQRVFT